MTKPKTKPSKILITVIAALVGVCCLGTLVIGGGLFLAFQGGMSFLSSAPVPGETLGDQTLQTNTLNIMWPMVSQDAMFCTSIRVSDTKLIEVLDEFKKDKGIMVSGKWVEMWTVAHCKVETVYKTTYTADGVGGFYIAAQRWP
jgi:hypothetical protein